MSDFWKVQIANLLASARFWVTTFVLYLNERGLPLDQIFWLLSFYYICSMLLEYPTGVIGDYYSHKVSVFFGYTLLAVSFFLFSISGGLSYYIFVALVQALATALISGSDTALFHAVSKNFEEQYANLSTLSVVVTFSAITLGGFVATWDLRYPLYLSAFCVAIGAFLLLTLKHYTYERDSANIFETAKRGVRFSLTHKQLFYTLLLAALLGAIFFDYKWLYNPIFEAARLPLAWWGIVTGGAVLSIGLGAKLTTWYPKLSWTIISLLIAVGLALSGATNSISLVFLGLFISHVLRGYMDTSYMVSINGQIEGKIRSSVLSFNSVLIRLGASIYMGIGGLFISKVSIPLFMFLTALLFGCLSLFLMYKLHSIRPASI